MADENEDIPEMSDAEILHDSVQHDIDNLNSSLLNQLQRLQTFESRFSRLEHEIQMIHAPQEPNHPDPGDERPPHY